MRNFWTVIFASLLISCGNDLPDGISEEFDEALRVETDINPYAVKPEDAPDSGCEKMKINGIGGTLGKIFSDLNPEHLAVARPQGISQISDLASAWENGKDLCKIESDEYIYIDSLTHSYPYLTPAAADLLHDIGKRFNDELQARGGGRYRLKVTSMLRTDSSVAKLRRVNRNASGESAHCHGTTFDISYSKFICDDPTDVRRTFEDLKNLLAEVVNQLRQEGRCLVKHERRQACLHITAIAPEENITDYEEAAL